ncbi:hypothetical protein IBA8401_29450 [Pseudomonas syringae]|jgi:hypothetical protein|nr:hypothetical protein D5S12_19155 [Pseudomonas syringae]
MQYILKIDALINPNVLPLTPPVDNYLIAHLPRQTYNQYIKPKRDMQQPYSKPNAFVITE